MKSYILYRLQKSFKKKDILADVYNNLIQSERIYIK